MEKYDTRHPILEDMPWKLSQHYSGISRDH